MNSKNVINGIKSEEELKFEYINIFKVKSGVRKSLWNLEFRLIFAESRKITDYPSTFREELAWIAVGLSKKHCKVSNHLQVLLLIWIFRIPQLIFPTMT